MERLYIFTGVCLSTGGRCTPPSWPGTHPPEQTPPWPGRHLPGQADIPLGRHPTGPTHTPLGRHPPEQTPPWPGRHLPGQADIPLGRHPTGPTHTPLGRHPSWADTPLARQTPPPPRPGRHHPVRQTQPRADCHCSGRYAASYWNAFLSDYKVTINHSSVQQKATVHTGYKIFHEQLHTRKNFKYFMILCNVVVCFFWWWGGGGVGLLRFHFKMQQVSIHCFLCKYCNSGSTERKGFKLPKPC